MTYDNSNSFQPHEHARALWSLGGRTDSQALRHDLTCVRFACVLRVFCVRFACVLRPTCSQLSHNLELKNGRAGDFPLPGFLLYKERSSRSDRELREMGYRNPKAL